MEQEEKLDGIRFADQESQNNYCQAVGWKLRDKVILITGPTGSGKSRLAQYMLAFLVRNHLKDYRATPCDMISRRLVFEGIENIDYLWVDEIFGPIDREALEDLDPIVKTDAKIPLPFPIIFSGGSFCFPLNWRVTEIRLAPYAPEVIIPPVAR